MTDPTSTRRYRLTPRTGIAGVVPARAYVVPLAGPGDHASVAHFQPAHRAPVHLDHFQYFDFLSGLVQSLWTTLGAQARVYLQVRAPFYGSLPAALLDPRVLLGSRLTDKMRDWAACTGQPAVSVVDAIRRDLDCPGDNTLACHVPDRRWLGPLDAALARCTQGWHVAMQPVAALGTSRGDAAGPAAVATVAAPVGPGGRA